MDKLPHTRDMGIHLVVNANISANGEYIFSLALAPDPKIVAQPANANQQTERRVDRILPVGSSAIAPGMSLAIPL